MNPLALGVGEFQLFDKLAPADYLDNRTAKLREFYHSNPEMAREVLSVVYPHKRHRPWEHTEIQERLGIPAVAKVASQVVAQNQAVFRKIAFDFLANQLPSVSAAMEAFQASRAQQEYMDAQRNAASFPALHATQPAMMMAQQQMAYGGDPSFSAPPVHHRRHRHHTG